tara:strand:- start:3661 stop:4107 length:447 start_codon:yes stop_codon:yes gene_type:complete
MKIKLDKTLMFVLLLGVLILASLGFTIKESFESKVTTEDEIQMSDSGSSYDPFGNASGAQSALPRGIPKSQILAGEEDLYIKKSEVVPPVCPKCPDTRSCPRPKPCAPCPPCGRCPEPAFECKKVPNYSAATNSKLPRPFLNDFSQFT